LHRAADRVRQTQLGNRTNLGMAQAKGRAVNTTSADAFAHNVMPIIRQI
jgi:hypothetical protein